MQILSTLSKTSMALVFSIMASAPAIADQHPTGAEPENVVADEQVEEPEGFQTHPVMQSDPSVYANNFFLAYIRSSEPSQNRMTEAGLERLAAELTIHTGIPVAGIVALNPETDDFSLFPYIHWKVFEDTERLSEQARGRLQDHLARPSTTLFINYADTIAIANSQTLPGILRDIGSGAFRSIEECNDVWTRSFYLTDAPDAVFSEVIPEESVTIDTPSVILSDQDFSIYWEGTNVGPDVYEESIRLGTNIIMATFMGTYKLDDDHEETIQYKCGLREETRTRPLDEGFDPLAGQAPAAEMDDGP